MEKFSRRYIQYAKRSLTVAVAILTIGSGLFIAVRSEAQTVSTDTQAVVDAVNDSSANIQMTLALGFGAILFLASAVMAFNYAKKV